MPAFSPQLASLPPPQRRLWPELASTPDHFVLYGGTALVLAGAERVQVAPNTLTCRVERDGPILVSFFGDLKLGRIAPPDPAPGTGLRVASLRDIAGTKVAVIQKRAEAKDYIDIDALLRNGVGLTEALEAGRIVYGRAFNPLITLKALSYFDDVVGLPEAVVARLKAAVAALDLAAVQSAGNDAS